MRVFADCQLTADTSPTESRATPHGARLFVQNPVGSFRLTLPTRRLEIGQRFQRVPSVGSRQPSPYSYGVMPPPSDMAADIPHPPTVKGQPHGR